MNYNVRNSVFKVREGSLWTTIVPKLSVVVTQDDGATCWVSPVSRKREGLALELVGGDGFVVLDMFVEVEKQVLSRMVSAEAVDVAKMRNMIELFEAGTIDESLSAPFDQFDKIEMQEKLDDLSNFYLDDDSGLELE